MLSCFLLPIATADSQITVTIPPTPLPAALAILSKATGSHLEASPRYRDEVLVARLHNASKDLLLQHIAHTFEARWEPLKDGTLRLVRDATEERRREKETAAKERETVRESLKYVRKRLAEQPQELIALELAKLKDQLAEEKKKVEEALDAGNYSSLVVETRHNEETPGWRAAARLANLLGEETIFRMPNFAREVWSDAPTPMQHPFPLAASSILDAYRHELVNWAPDMPVSRIRFVITKWEDGGSSTVQITALSANGTKVDTDSVRLANDSEKLKRPGGLSAQPAPEPGEKPLVIPDDILAFRKMMSQFYKGPPGEKKALFTKWKRALLSPDKFEPTYWGDASDWILAAEQRDANLVAKSDDAQYLKYGKPQSKLYASRILGQQLHVASDGWWENVRPPESPRLSRSTAGQSLRKCVSLGGLAVNDAAAFVASQKDSAFPFINWYGDYLARLFPSLGGYSTLSTLMSEHDLRLWNALGGRTENVVQDSTGRIGTIPPAAKELLYQYVYWHGGLDTKGESTELLPSGITDGTFTISVKEKPIFIPFSSVEGEPNEPMPLDPEVFGQYLAKGNTYWGVNLEKYRSMDRFRMGVQRTYSLIFKFANDVTATIQLPETFFDPSAEPLTKLPDAMAVEVEKARKEQANKPDPPKWKD